MSLSQIVQESVEKFDTSYNEEYKPMWGCCCGDYCTDGHNDRITNFLISSQISLLEAELERKNGMKENNACYEPHYVKDTDCTCGKFKTAKETDAYNQAIQEDITYLQEQIEEIKKLI